MIKDFDVHPIQANILRELLFVTKGSFGELNKNKVGTDLFSFHLKQLIGWGLVEKKDGKYSLSTRGKEFANRFDTDKVEVEKQGKVAVLIVVTRDGQNGKEYLIQQRRKQPSFGYWGFITGKIRWGETILEGATRELMEETDLRASLKICGVKHKMDYDQNGKILEDKYFWVIAATEVVGEMMEEFEGGRNAWMTREEIINLDKQFDGVVESMEMTKNGAIFGLSENKYNVRGY
jgi:8-oxo-dGTP pyrophosphatase MutT (NUDIX family)